MAKRPPNYDQMSWEDKALWDYMNAGDEFVAGGAPVYQAGTPLEYSQLNPQDLAKLGQSAYGGITTDPRLANAEYDALSSLEQRSKGSGLTLQDEADIAKLQGQVSARNRGRQGAIQQEMQSRGMTGSGMDLVARMQAAQDATENESLAALEKAAQAQAGQRDATDRLSARASAMRGQQFSEQAQKAAAQDAIARFNAQNQVQQQQMNWQAQNQAAQQNWARQNQTSDNNTNGQYGFRKDKMGTQQNNQQMAYNKAVDDYNRAQLKKQRKGGKVANVFSGAAQGAIAGGTVAGPWGAAAGGIVGAAANYAHGGRVPGDSPFPGDSEMNDIFDAQLSPGEVVLPRTVASDPKQSAQYVAAVNQGMDPMAAKYIAQNETQKRAEHVPFYPTLTGAPISQYSRRTDGGAAPVKDLGEAPAMRTEVLSALAQKNPSLVEQYKAKVGAADQKVEDARQNQKYLDAANLGGKVITDALNNRQQSVILKNRMQDLGKAPEVVDPTKTQWDSSTLANMGARGVQQAASDRDLVKNEFMTEQSLAQADRAAAASDPNSDQSKAARAFIGSIIPGAAAKIAGMSAAQLEKASPVLMEKFKADQAQSNADRTYNLDVKKLDASSQKPLSESGQKTVNYAAATLTGLRDMRNALEKGDNTFSLMGDNSFTEARRRAAENFGRLQSGGAISKDEEARFIQMLPTWTDSPEMQKQKLAKLEAEMRARIGAEGVDADAQVRARNTPTQIDPADQQAAQWAQANPNDPRAAKIVAKLRSKYGQ